ncbi:MAG: efflux RND transporter periplasmic adaptor subunit [Calditrichales bacterium]|nr:MAG: efflux RND transporter periplasmic adaptor subunit [Calditrichales bacterium]
MKKTLIIVAVVVVLGALVAANFLKKEKGTRVDVEEVTRGTVMQKVTGSGQIRPEVQVKISARVAGKILKLHAEEGDHVKKGELLVELDQEQYLAALERTESTLMSMTAGEKKSKSEMSRSQDLYKKGLMSEAEFEAMEAAYEAAQGNTRQARATVNEAKDALAKTRLHSDMDGIVTRLNKEEGEIALGAQFQEDVIMIVADLSRMEAAIEVDENDVINVSLGDTANIEIDAFVDTTFKGIVSKIANSANVKGLGTQEQVTNFEVTVALLDVDMRFRPGMSTTVDIITEVETDVLKVPIQAVTARGKDVLEKEPGIEERPEAEASLAENPGDNKPEMTEVVFCVVDKKAVSRQVKLGISDDLHYVVLSGIEEGDKVVTGPFRVLSRTLKNDDLLEFDEKKKENSHAD